MTITINNHYKLHVFIFALLSLHLFVFLPVSFISKFLATAICLGVLLNIQKISFEARHWYEIAAVVSVNAYLTVAFFGYDLLLSPSFYTERFLRIFTLALGFCWTSYVLLALINVLNWVAQKAGRFTVATNGSYWKKWIVLFTIMLFQFSIWQIAFNPIVLSPDSWGYMGGWLDGNYNTWRSPILAFCINIVCSFAPIGPKVMWIAIWQNIAFSALLSTLLMYFYQRGVRFKIVVLFAIFLPLVPSLGLHTIVVWCDLSTGMTMLWLTYALVRIIDEMILHQTASKNQQISLCVQLCLSMLLAYFIRSNSFLVYLIITPILVILFAIKKRRELLAAITASVALVLLIQFPLYSALGVEKDKMNEVGKYYAGIHDIQATYYAGGKLSSQTESALKKYIENIDEPEAREGFRPDWFMYSIYKTDLSELTTRDFIGMYADTFVNNPGKMLKSIMWRMRAYWVIDTKGGIGCVNYTAIFDRTGGAYADLAPELDVYRQPNFLTSVMSKFISRMAMQIPATFVWRYGIWTALLIVSALTLILRKQWFWLIAYLPIFLYLITLILSMPWHDYRYGLSVLFIGMFLPTATLFLKEKESDGEPKIHRKKNKGHK